ncbi:hypothetical protein [Acetobacterium tundrae]|uniref:Uncharacterized protein n=1 Tax=Acetobacterium tundrae TaxID=132932 RepID=A0ABR6WQ79_9FIRM|nr:hypothetical protein [Acetobacterium tundrae]MBC3798478.1 hypothetical protein [Acetobacterium tundrae]
MNKITAEFSDEMKITVEINGNEYSETWYQVKPGVSKTREKKGISDQLEAVGFDELGEIMTNSFFLHDIWEAINE